MINFDQTGRRAAYDRLQAAARLTRTWGDGYGYLMVATGRADVMVDPIMALWDAAALPPILEEAGGTFTDWRGNARLSGRRRHRHQRPAAGRSDGGRAVRPFHGPFCGPDLRICQNVNPTAPVRKITKKVRVTTHSFGPLYV